MTRLNSRMVWTLRTRRLAGHVVIYCTTDRCPNYMVTVDRTPRPWVCQTCEDKAREADVQRMSERERLRHRRGQ